MHNCNATRERLSELVLDGANRSLSQTLSAELRACAECRAEFEALQETLRITTRVIKAAAPAETYWADYHARLRQKLRNASSTVVNEKSERSWLIRFLTSSVRVPIPVGIALILVSGVSLLFANRASEQNISSPQIPSVVHVPVEVPVIQERIVTRVVYRQRELRSPSRKSNPTMPPRRDDSVLVKSQKRGTDVNQMSLVGFKPLEEIKLTVIKGGSQDEK
jgi:anti-sigma factor RsiW